jgi:hypothetical protein
MLTCTTLDDEAIGRDKSRCHDERNASPTAHIEGEELVDEARIRKSKIAAGELFSGDG